MRVGDPLYANDHDARVGEVYAKDDEPAEQPVEEPAEEPEEEPVEQPTARRRTTR